MSSNAAASFWGVVSDTETKVNSAAFDDVQARVHEREGDLENKIDHLQALLSQRPCAWVPDEDRTKCFSCRTAFSLFNRRHHCRACGEVFDSRCTQKNKSLATYPKAGPQRVCDACFVLRDASGSASSVDFAKLAGVLTGLPGAADDDGDDNDDEKEQGRRRLVLRRDDFKVEVVRNTLRFVDQHASSTTTASLGVKGKTRSEIPVPPPLPAIIPQSSSSSSRPAAIILPGGASTLKSASKRALLSKVVTAGNIKMELDDIQNGLRSLRKVVAVPMAAASAPTTPTQSRHQHQPSAHTELQLSMRKRRLAMEDSPPPFAESHAASSPCNFSFTSSSAKKSPVKKARHSTAAAAAAATQAYTPAAASRHLLESIIGSVRKMDAAADGADLNLSINRTLNNNNSFAVS